LLLSVCYVVFGLAFCGGVSILVLSEQGFGLGWLILLAIFMLRSPSRYVHVREEYRFNISFTIATDA